MHSFGFGSLLNSSFIRARLANLYHMNDAGNAVKLAMFFDQNNITPEKYQ